MLPGLGDPEHPLDLVSQRTVGAPFVGLAELAKLAGEDAGRAAA